MPIKSSYLHTLSGTNELCWIHLVLSSCTPPQAVPSTKDEQRKCIMMYINSNWWLPVIVVSSGGTQLLTTITCSLFHSPNEALAAGVPSFLLPSFLHSWLLSISFPLLLHLLWNNVLSYFSSFPPSFCSFLPLSICSPFYSVIVKYCLFPFHGFPLFNFHRF